MSELLRVKNLQVSYYNKPVVSDVSFSVAAGSIVGMVGPNGAGKSTLLKAILGFIPPDKGQVCILGQPLKNVRHKIAYVPQRRDIDWDFPINVLDTVLIGTYPGLGIMRRPGKKEREWAMHCLETVKMEDCYRRQIGELSGGQQGRVFMARALAQRPELLLLDEPFVGIDMNSEEMIMNSLRDLRRQGRAIVIVHHDLSKVKKYFDTVLIINNRLIAYGPADDCFTEKNIAQAYKSELMLIPGLGVGA